MILLLLRRRGERDRFTNHAHRRRWELLQWNNARAKRVSETWHRRNGSATAVAAATASDSHPPAGRGGKKTWARTRRRWKYINDVAATLGLSTVADCNMAVAAADGRWSARAKIIKSEPTTTNPFRAPRTTTTTTAMRPPARPRSCRWRPRSSISALRRASAELYIFNYIIGYYYIICLKIILVRARADSFFGIHSAQCLPDNKQYGFFFLLFTRSIRPPCSTRVYFCIVYTI